MLCGTTVRWREKKTKMILANQYQLYRIPNNKSEMMASPFFFFLTFCYLFSTFKVFLIMLLFIFPVYSRAYPPHKAEQPLTNAGQIVISNGRLLLQANYISRNSETYLISYHKILIFSAFFFSFLYPGIQMQSLPKINVSFVIPNGLCDPTKPHQKVEEK